MLLYRFIELDAFIDILVNRRMYLRQVTSWEDPYETDAVVHLMEKLLVKTDLANKNEKDSKPASARVAQLRETLKEAIFAHARNSIYAQSWTELPESDALWRIYSPGRKGLRLSVERDALLEAISKSLPDVEHFEVEYCSSNAARRRLSARFNPRRRIDLTLCCRYKRPEFAHEKEYRFCISQNPAGFRSFKLGPPDYDLGNEEDLKKAIDKLHEFRYDRVKYFPFEPSLIQQVTLDPRLPPGDWFEKALGGLCAAHGISEVRRSDLYTQKA